jgi:hypothetical protein
LAAEDTRGEGGIAGVAGVDQGASSEAIDAGVSEGINKLVHVAEAGQVLAIEGELGIAFATG